jgi:hypothetical protein
MCVLMVCQNPVQSLIGLQLTFAVYFFYESMSNTYFIETPSWCNSKRVFPINSGLLSMHGGKHVCASSGEAKR